MTNINNFYFPNVLQAEAPTHAFNALKSHRSRGEVGGGRKWKKDTVSTSVTFCTNYTFKKNCAVIPNGLIPYKF